MKRPRLQPPGTIRYAHPVNFSTAKALVADLERHPRRIELFTTDFEAFILRTMDAVYELANCNLFGRPALTLIASA